MQYQEQSSQFYGARCDDNGSWVREDLLAAGAASISPVLLAASEVPIHEASRGPAAWTPVRVKQPSSGQLQLSAHCIQRDDPPSPKSTSTLTAVQSTTANGRTPGQYCRDGP